MPLFDHTTTHEDLRLWCAWLCGILDASESVSRWPSWANRQQIIEVAADARWIWQGFTDTPKERTEKVKQVIETTTMACVTYHQKARQPLG